MHRMIWRERMRGDQWRRRRKQGRSGLIADLLVVMHEARRTVAPQGPLDQTNNCLEVYSKSRLGADMCIYII